MRNTVSAGLLVCSGWIAFAAPAHAADSDNPLTALLMNHVNAMKNRNVDAAVGAFSAAPDVVLLGTGPGERWIGKEEISNAYKHFFTDFDAGSMTVNCDSQTSESDQSLAWLTAICEFSDSLDGKRREYTVHLSAVAENEKDSWKFRTLHISNITHDENQKPE